jgi:hypothetical protein
MDKLKFTTAKFTNEISSSDDNAQAQSEDPCRSPLKDKDENWSTAISSTENKG